MSSEETLLRLIREASTIRQVQSFLQERGFPYSASSWEILIDNRVRPALQGGLTEDELFALLSEAEEFGQQHVFLYRRKRGKGRGIPDSDVVAKWLRNTPDEDLLVRPRLLEHPDVPTLAEIRREGDNALCLKVIETRMLVHFVGEREEPNGNFVREYRREPVRAVNVARLTADGLLEIRIYSHRAQGRSYIDDLPTIWGLLAGLIDADDFSEWSLTQAKQALWEQRAALSGRVRFSKASLRDTSGTTMDCSTGSSDFNLFDDDAAEAGLRTFHRKGRAYCDRHNVWWLQQKGGIPSKDVHVLLAGAPHEFAVTMQCTRHEYEYVLAELRRLNQ